MAFHTPAHFGQVGYYSWLGDVPEKKAFGVPEKKAFLSKGGYPPL